VRFALPSILLIAGTIGNAASDPANPLRSNSQCIIVITDSWRSSGGVLHSFEREDNSKWKQHSGPIPILVGRAGLAWGRGELNSIGLPGPVKREGDDKAPAGIFRLGTAFGYGRKPADTKLPYLMLSRNIVAVDDPASRYYNQLLNKTKVAKPDWRSAENMILADNRYQWGVVVLHNVPPVSGAGSCIFLHAWKDSSTATSGCTAMSKNSLLKLIRWLDPTKDPLFVQLPHSIYNEERPGWGLPLL
jgi:D-alanyl-D-alanine dipeptidase